jgi:hypothetical protein
MKRYWEKKTFVRKWFVSFCYFCGKEIGLRVIYLSFYMIKKIFFYEYLFSLKCYQQLFLFLLFVAVVFCVLKRSLNPKIEFFLFLFFDRDSHESFFIHLFSAGQAGQQYYPSLTIFVVLNNFFPSLRGEISPHSQSCISSLRWQWIVNGYKTRYVYSVGNSKGRSQSLKYWLPHVTRYRFSLPHDSPWDNICVSPLSQRLNLIFPLFLHRAVTHSAVCLMTAP